MTKKPTLEERKAASEKMGAIFEQKDVNYVMLSATPGKACANCVFYRHDHYGEEKYPQCHIVYNWPEPIEPTGWCDRHEMKPEPPEPGPTIEEAIEDLADAIGDVVGVELSADGKRDLYISPSMSLRKNLMNRLGGSIMSSGMSVLKDAAGRRYMFMVTSNGYKDRDKEHVATKALQQYVDSCWTGDDTAFIGDNEHYIWHMKELGSISDLMFADVWSGFLVELWREQSDNPIAKGFYNYVERHPEIEWGASHGFQGVLKGDTFAHINKFESTSLPLDAAANLLTLSEVLPMNAKSKRDSFLNQFFQEEFGVEDAAATLREGPDKLRAKLAKNGVQAKALGEGSDALKQAKADALANTAETLIAIVEVQDEYEKKFEKEIGEAKTAIAGYEKQMKDLQTQIGGYEAQVKELREIVNAGPQRAVKAGTTVVTDEAALAAAKEQSVEYDPAFPGMKVPLEKKT